MPPTSVEVSYELEPDDFPHETDLTLISPHLRLYTALDTNEIVELFYVTATDDGQGLAPTGQRVFGHFNIPFFNDDRRLVMVFDVNASAVSIAFAGGTFSQTETGRLQVFGAGGQALAEYVTSPRGAGEIEVMTITRDSADIAFAIAY
ncbi:MAG: hypothetical protein AB7Q17_12260, partial [Phycisphaerae bacterium]